MSKLVNPFFHVVQIPLYRQNVIFSINQTDDELLDSILKAGPLWPKGRKRSKSDIVYLLEAFHDKTNDARTVRYENGVIIARFYKISSIYLPENLATFNHEVFHVTSFIASAKGLELTSSSEEAYSYLSGFITEDFFKTYQKINQL